MQCNITHISLSCWIYLQTTMTTWPSKMSLVLISVYFSNKKTFEIFVVILTCNSAVFLQAGDPFVCTGTKKSCTCWNMYLDTSMLKQRCSLIDKIFTCVARHKIYTSVTQYSAMWLLFWIQVVYFFVNNSWHLETNQIYSFSALIYHASRSTLTLLFRP